MRDEGAVGAFLFGKRDGVSPLLVLSDQRQGGKIFKGDRLPPFYANFLGRRFVAKAGFGYFLIPTIRSLQGKIDGDHSLCTPKSEEKKLLVFGRVLESEGGDLAF